MNDQYTFNLSETLAWQRGFAIDEILGIALVPELSMETADNYLSIRGVIELKGEFYPKKEEETKELRESDNQFRIVDNIDVMEDGPYSFFHHFPVEVSIPLSRVHNVNDVEVEITRFDYNLPNSKSLGVFAVLSLNGVLAESVEDINEFTLEEEYRNQINVDDSTSLENEEFPLNIPNDNKVIDFHSENTEIDNIRSEKVDSEIDTNNYKEIENQSLEEIRNEKEEKETIDNEALSSNLDEKEEDENNSETDRAIEIKVDESQEIRSENNYQDSSYLLNMFNDKEEARYKPLKMHIVQEDDTLEKIAERYQLPQTKLIKINRLDDNELKIGDIIYIPVSTESTT